MGRTTLEVVEGNYIGVDAAGSAVLGNGGNGVYIGGGSESRSTSRSGSGNRIGGTAAGAGNVISGNGLDGIYIAAGIMDLITGNFIGTNAPESVALPNAGDGVGLVDGALNNTIGGTASGAGNTIAFNGGNGVMVGSDTTDDSTGNAILGNSIYANAELGINLGDESSPTGTPTGTTPSGPNDLQNAPVLSAATGGGASTTISGTLSSEANTTFRIEFFANPAGAGQGQTYLGFLDVTTDGGGSASFSFSPASPVAAGLNITATATDPGGNTSEFSASATVQPPIVNVTGDLSIKLGGLVFNRTTRRFTQSITITNDSAAPIVGPIELVLLNLKNATLFNQTGTYQGSPYITVLSSGSLGVGQSLTLTLVFNDPTLATIAYTTEFLAGPIPSDDGN